MNTKLFLKSLWLAAFFALVGKASAVQTLSLIWDSVDPTDPTLGYVVYYGSESGNYTGRVDVGTNTTYSLVGVDNGSSNYFVITCYGTSGIESDPSDEFVYVAPGNIFLAPGWQPGNSCVLTFAVCYGKSYQIQATSDLTNWTTIATTGSNSYTGFTTFIDTDRTTYQQRFYRLILQ